MPYLKFSRDKRGYEYFSLIEPGVPRRGRPARPRLLFWFRTPPQVKVGRHPFSDDVQRAIEQQNPGVRFDWPRLLSTPIPPPDADHWRERRRAEKAAKLAAKQQEADGVLEVQEAQGVHEVDDVPGGHDVHEVQDDKDVDAGQTVEVVASSDSGEAGAAETPAAAGGDPSGGSRRRNRRRRRRRHNAGGTAPSGVAPAVPGPPSEEV